MQALQFLAALLIGGVVLTGTLGGGGLLLISHAPAVLEGWESRSWPSTPAVVTRSATIQKASPSGWSRGGTGTHVVRIEYVYSVDGRTHTGARISLDHEGKIFSAENAQKIADRLPVGLRVAAHYDLARPERSLLEAGIPFGGVLGCAFGSLLIFAGITLVVLGVRIRSHLARRNARRAG